MNARRSVSLQLLALALAIGMSLLAWPFLRGLVPLHWGISGRADGWGPAVVPLVSTPLLLAGCVASSLALVRSPQRSNELFLLMVAVSAFFVAEHGVVLGAALFPFFSPVRPLLAIVFGLFVGIGPILARVDQNPWFGVRTPWTLGSRRVWKATHRRVGRLYVVGGLIGAGLSLVAPLVVCLGYLLLLALAPIAISYQVWLRLGRP